jgi:hypothetical protein
VSSNAEGQSNCVQAVFYVVEGNGQSLLGNFTAQELGVLKLGDSNSSSFWLTFFRSVNGILCIL